MLFDPSSFFADSFVALQDDMALGWDRFTLLVRDYLASLANN